MFYVLAVIIEADDLPVGINAIGDSVSAARGINRLIRICGHLLALDWNLRAARACPPFNADVFKHPVLIC